MKTALPALLGVIAMAVIPLSAGAEIPELADVTLRGDRLEIEFGELKFTNTNRGLLIENALDSVEMGGTVFDDAYVKGYGTTFSIKDLDDGFALYAVSNTNTGNPYDFSATVFYQGTRLATFLDLKPEIQREVPVVSEAEVTGYQPDLAVVMEHDFRTYWKESFDFQIMAFDINKTPAMIDKDTFDGRLDGANVTAIISMDDNAVQSYGGITSSGEFTNSYFFEENISAPGEYTLDVVVSYLDQTVSESVPFFVIGTVPDFNTPRDTDNDGTPDHMDEDDDNDGTTDHMDEDDDNDGIPDENDACTLEAEDKDRDDDGCPDE